MLRRSFAVFAALSVLLGCTMARAAEDIGYDSRANAAAQLAEGVAHAKAEGKLVLAIAGGDWCIWCHYLNAFVKKNENVEKALYDTFVIVKVYYGDDNNEGNILLELAESRRLPSLLGVLRGRQPARFATDVAARGW